MPKQHGSSAYLDGIRGVAAFGVFLNHFTLAFYYAYFSQKTQAFHLDGREVDYSHSLLSFVNNGGFCVAIFFVLSGFVLSRKYFMTNETEALVSGFHRRFIRLYIPIAFTLILSYILMKNHLFFNNAASRITMSEWFIKWWNFLEPEKRLAYCLTYTTMFTGDTTFDTSLWTISYEFFGSLFVFAFLLFTHYTSRYRMLLMVLTMAYFFAINSPFYLAFVLGMTLCYTERWIKEKGTAPLATVVSFILLGTALTLGSLPFCSPAEGSWQENLKNSWDYTQWCPTIAGYLLILSFILSPLLQKIGSLRPFRFLGYISFSLYLIHPLLLGSFSAHLFLEQYTLLEYNNAVLVVFIASVAVLLPVSWLMARYVDQFGIWLSHRAYDKMRGVATATRSVAVTQEAMAEPKRPAIHAKKQMAR